MRAAERQPSNENGPLRGRGRPVFFGAAHPPRRESVSRCRYVGVMTNQFAHHFRSVAEAAVPVWGAVTDESLALPTPCAGWDVRELITHTVFTLQEAAVALEDVPAADELKQEARPGMGDAEAGNAADGNAVVAEPRAADEDDDEREGQPLMDTGDVLAEPGVSFVRALERLADSIEPLNLDQEAVLPFGRYEVGSLASMMLVDALVHTWDLGQAVGVPFAMPHVAADAAYTFSREMLVPELRSPDGDAAFGPEVPVGENAGLQEQFLGWLGRNPR